MLIEIRMKILLPPSFTSLNCTFFASSVMQFSGPFIHRNGMKRGKNFTLRWKRSVLAAKTSQTKAITGKIDSAINSPKRIFKAASIVERETSNRWCFLCKWFDFHFCWLFNICSIYKPNVQKCLNGWLCKWCFSHGNNQCTRSPSIQR